MRAGTGAPAGREKGTRRTLGYTPQRLTAAGLTLSQRAHAMTPAELAARWRSDAETFTRYGDEKLAKIARTHADELDAATRALDEDALDLATAARESGYSADRLRHMIADGSVPNAGRKGAPRVRRADLPRKARTTAGGFDAARTARDMLSLRSTPEEH